MFYLTVHFADQPMVQEPLEEVLCKYCSSLDRELASGELHVNTAGTICSFYRKYPLLHVFMTGTMTSFL